MELGCAGRCLQRLTWLRGDQASERNLRRALLLLETCRVAQTPLQAGQPLQLPDWELYIQARALGAAPTAPEWLPPSTPRGAHACGRRVCRATHAMSAGAVVAHRASTCRPKCADRPRPPPHTGRSWPARRQRRARARRRSWA